MYPGCSSREIVRCAWPFRRSPYAYAILFSIRMVSVLSIGLCAGSVRFSDQERSISAWSFFLRVAGPLKAQGGVCGRSVWPVRRRRSGRVGRCAGRNGSMSDAKSWQRKDDVVVQSRPMCVVQSRPMYGTEWLHIRGVDGATAAAATPGLLSSMHMIHIPHA